MRALVALLLWASLASAASVASAAGPEQSLRPVPRPVAEGPVGPAGPAGPVAQPAAETGEPAAVAQTVTRASAGMSLSLRPLLRSKSLEEKAMAKRRERARGSVCGDTAIQGEVVGPVPGRISGCGIESAVRITSVSGIAFSQPALMDCATAKAVRSWVDKSARPAFRNMGGGLAGLRVAAHYACRTRNNQTGARISEHGRGRAIDISGFQLRDGSIVTVLNGWGTRGQSQALRAVHRGACGPFGTVLGPEADRFHRDHFHFDTARYRSGPYCR